MLNNKWLFRIILLCPLAIMIFSGIGQTQTKKGGGNIWPGGAIKRVCCMIELNCTTLNLACDAQNNTPSDWLALKQAFYLQLPTPIEPTEWDLIFDNSLAHNLIKFKPSGAQILAVGKFNLSAGNGGTGQGTGSGTGGDDEVCGGLP